PILNAAHIMRVRRDDPTVVEQMREMVERQVRSMARLVEDLLDVSRITRGKIQLRLESANLTAVVQHAADTIRPTLQARGRSRSGSRRGRSGSRPTRCASSRSWSTC